MKTKLTKAIVLAGVLFVPFAWQVYKWHLIMFQKLGASIEILTY